MTADVAPDPGPTPNATSDMLPVRVGRLDDPRLDDFRHIKDKPLLDRGLFLAEGHVVVERLLHAHLAGTVRARAVLLAEHRVPAFAPLVPPDVQTFIAPGREVSRLLGFPFHSGVIGLGLVPASPPLELAVPRTGEAHVVVLPETASAENLGTLIRLAAALGVHAVLCGPRCAHPFLRRTVRVSMGAVFSIPVLRSADLHADLRRLGTAFGFELLATVLSPDAEPLGRLPAAPRSAVLFGPEGPGLAPADIAACHRRITIPMHAGIDSLNVGVAAGIVLWELFARPHAAGPRSD